MEYNKDISKTLSDIIRIKVPIKKKQYIFDFRYPNFREYLYYKFSLVSETNLCRALYIGDFNYIMEFSPAIHNYCIDKIMEMADYIVTEQKILTIMDKLDISNELSTIFDMLVFKTTMSFKEMIELELNDLVLYICTTRREEYYNKKKKNKNGIKINNENTEVEEAVFGDLT